MQFKQSVSIATLVAALSASGGASAQQVIRLQPALPDTTPANVNVLNLLSPYLALNATATGRATLQSNLDQGVAVNQTATAAQQALAISDKGLFGGASGGSITLANGTTLHVGVADNLAGGEPLQAIQQSTDRANPTFGKPGTINPLQPVGGYGVVLGSTYQTGARASTATTGPLAATANLLGQAYAFTGSDLGVAKNYFANGAATNAATMPYYSLAAVAPAGYTLPTANGLPNTTNSVYDLAYGVTNTQSGQDVYGSSRPVQVALNRYNTFDPAAIDNITTNPSFPSGHTTYAFTDSILLGMLTPQLYQSMLLRASEYGNSRIQLGVHYPLDIIASRAFVAYDLAQAFTNPLYINNAATTGSATATVAGVPTGTGTGQAINLPALFTAAQANLAGYLQANLPAGCGTTVAGCATSAANTAGNPYTGTAANAQLYRDRLTYGLPTLTLAQAPREAAPAGGPDASILLAPLYGGSTAAARTLAPNGGLYGSLQSGTINQIIVNTEGNALAAFYGTPLSYWSRINLYDAAGYFDGATGTLTLDARDRVTRNVVVGRVDAFGSVVGALYDNGTITGTAVVNAGSLFGGTGTVGGLAALSGSTVAPGTAPGAIGTLSVAGNAAFAAGTTFQVATSAAGQSSQLAVAGTTTLLGGTVQALPQAGTYDPRTQYTVLTSTGGVTGQFAAATSASPALAASLRYRPNEVDLTLTRTDIAFSVIAQNRNQAAVADAIQGAGPGAGVYDRTIGLTTPEARVAFQALSGDIHASAQSSLFETAFFVREAILDRLRRDGTPGEGGTDYGSLPATYTADLPGRSAPVAQVPARVLDPRVFGVWGQGFGAFGDARSDGNAAGLTRQISGFVLGADVTLENGFRIGVAGGYAYTNLDTSGRLQSAEIDSAYGAVYAGNEYGPIAVRAGAVYADNALRTRRSVVFPGLSEVDTGRYGGSTIQGFGELGWRIALGNAQPPAVIGKDLAPRPAAYGATYIEPFVGGAYVNLNQDRFVEGGGIGALRGLGRDNDVETFTAGLRGQTVWDLGLGVPVSAYGLVGYRRAFGDVVPAALLAFATGPSFITAGIPINRDAVVANAGLDLRVSARTTIGVSYTGQAGERAQDHAVKGNFTYRW